MGKDFGILLNAAVGDPAFPQISVYQDAAAPIVRGRIFEFMISSGANPADQCSTVSLNRISTAAPNGGAALTEEVFDEGETNTSTLQGYGSATGGTTLGNDLLVVCVNQRATFRWVAVPGKEMVIGTTQFLGGGLVVSAQSAAYNIATSLMWSE